MSAEKILRRLEVTLLVLHVLCLPLDMCWWLVAGAWEGLRRGVRSRHYLCHLLWIGEAELERQDLARLRAMFPQPRGSVLGIESEPAPPGRPHEREPGHDSAPLVRRATLP